MRERVGRSWFHRFMLNAPAPHDLELDLVNTIDQHLQWSRTRLVNVAAKHAATARDLAIVLACLRGEVTTLHIESFRPDGDHDESA